MTTKSTKMFIIIKETCDPSLSLDLGWGHPQNKPKNISVHYFAYRTKSNNICSIKLVAHRHGDPAC